MMIKTKELTTENTSSTLMLPDMESARDSQNFELNLTHEHLSKGYERINRLFLEHTSNEKMSRLILSELCKQVKCYHAVLYKADIEQQMLTLLSGYGLANGAEKKEINFGAGQVGQAAIDNKEIIIRNIPEGYVKISSGLGETSPTWIAIMPLSFKGQAYGVLEMCFLYNESKSIKNHLNRVAELFGAHLFNQGVIAKQSQLQQLEQEKLRSEAILEGCSDGFIGFNKEGIIDFCNKSAAELLRLRKEDVLGQSIGSLLDVSIEEHDEGNYEIIHHGIERTKLAEKTEIQISDSHNEEIDVLVTANTISVAGDILFTLFLQKISVDLF